MMEAAIQELQPIVVNATTAKVKGKGKGNPGQELIKIIETRMQSHTSMSSNNSKVNPEDLNRLQPSSLS